MYPLVFSNQTRLRFTRHFLFWMVWLLYYSLLPVMYRLQAGSTIGFAIYTSLTETLLYIPVDIFICYTIIYYLLPTFLFKGKYMQMLFFSFLLAMIGVLLFRYINMYLTPLVRYAVGISRPVNVQPLWENFLQSFPYVTMEASMAAAIRLGKMWYIKQQETRSVVQQPITDSLLKPATQQLYLVNAFADITRLIETRSPLVNSLSLKMNHLLAYTVYEGNRSIVPLETEISLLEDYVAIVKAGNERTLQVHCQITGNATNQQLAPYILLPLTDNAFRQLLQLPMETKQMDMQLQVSDQSLHLQLSWNKPPDTSTLAHGGDGLWQHMQQRLQLLYPRAHRFHIILEPERMRVSLRINLRARAGG
jgi:hypothetical protein